MSIQGNVAINQDELYKMIVNELKGYKSSGIDVKDEETVAFLKELIEIPLSRKVLSNIMGFQEEHEYETDQPTTVYSIYSSNAYAGCSMLGKDEFNSKDFLNGVRERFTTGGSLE